MKEALTHTAALVGSAILAHLAGSSVLGFLSVTSSSTFTWSPFFRRTMTSLLMAAWPRTFTLGCVTTAGPAVTGTGFIGSAAAAADFLGAVADFFAAAFLFFAG